MFDCYSDVSDVEEEEEESPLCLVEEDEVIEMVDLVSPAPPPVSVPSPAAFSEVGQPQGQAHSPISIDIQDHDYDDIDVDELSVPIPKAIRSLASLQYKYSSPSNRIETVFEVHNLVVPGAAATATASAGDYDCDSLELSPVSHAPGSGLTLTSMEMKYSEQGQGTATEQLDIEPTTRVAEIAPELPQIPETAAELAQMCIGSTLAPAPEDLIKRTWTAPLECFQAQPLDLTFASQERAKAYWRRVDELIQLNPDPIGTRYLLFQGIQHIQQWFGRFDPEIGRDLIKQQVLSLLGPGNDGIMRGIDLFLQPETVQYFKTL